VFATVPPPPERVLVFARLPELGKVKTRLAQSIGDEKALAVYEAMLRDLLPSLGPPTEQTDIEILWAPTEGVTGERLTRAFGDYATAIQTGENLGDRLAMAFAERFYFHRTDKIVAIGVDDPRLSRAMIDHALALLESCEWVLGPAADGGYYLIGCRAAAYDVRVFTGVQWGSASVLRETLARIGASEQTVATLPERYDIDVEDDLRRYAAEGDGGALGELLREWERRGMLNV
jgi:rSAM/selenodomain-associated transferase 1